MKTLLTISTLVFTLMFSTTSFAGWTKLGTNVNGDTYYVDFERIRKHGGYVYFWVLENLLKPFNGHLSDKAYFEGDCRLFRIRGLSTSFHKEPMGRGTPDGNFSNKNPNWIYPPPNSVNEVLLKSVCSR
jgi:hypothetical protein